MSGVLRRKSRYLCCQALYQWRMNAQAPDAIVMQFLSDNQTITFDETYFSKLFLGVIEQQSRLMRLLSPIVADTRLTPIEEVTLWMAAYELCNEPELPTAVIIMKPDDPKSTAQPLGTFVNAVLDKLAQQVRHDEVEAIAYFMAARPKGLPAAPGQW